jgi:hypothetical protein
MRAPVRSRQPIVQLGVEVLDAGVLSRQQIKSANLSVSLGAARSSTSGSGNHVRGCAFLDSAGLNSWDEQLDGPLGQVVYRRRDLNPTPTGTRRTS